MSGASDAAGHKGLTPWGLSLLQHRLWQYNFLRNWTPEEHKDFPVRLKEAAKLLLLAAASNPSSASPRKTGDACNSLQCLPCCMYDRL